jgi:uncharacterized repeat protein (TIGR03803 family)
VAGLIQGTDGNLYGTTEFGGANNTCNNGGPPGCGTIYEITLEGTVTTVHSFDETDGANPYTPLVQDTSGVFYGTTLHGGTNNDGTLFTLSMGLGPFVKTVPGSGRVGKSIKILGTDLTGASSVTFNGTTATFTVSSASLITTTVPAGATTGPVQVVTPSGTLTSNVNFQVLP